MGSGGVCAVDDVVEFLSWGLSVQDDAGSAVEAVLDGLDLGVGDIGEAGAFGEVLADQAVGVLVGGALPGAVGVGEVDRDVGGGGEVGVPGHLASLVPGDRGPYGSGQVSDHGLQGGGDGLGVVAGAQAVYEHEAAGALHQGDQGAAPAGADDQVALPVTRHGPVGGLGRAHTDLGPLDPGTPGSAGQAGQR